LISHNLVDVFAVADRLAALYLGRVAGVAEIKDIDTQRAVELITTGSLSQPAAHTAGKD
jgi:D-xylose transport system ATP-binding protein